MWIPLYFLLIYMKGVLLSAFGVSFGTEHKSLDIESSNTYIIPRVTGLIWPPYLFSLIMSAAFMGSE